MRTTEKIYQYLLDVVEDRREGKVETRITRGLLLGLSRLYELVVQFRWKLFKWGVLRAHSAGCLVISVGNITVGGTGKTPVVEMLARALKESDRSVVVLSRGYRGREPFLKKILRKSVTRKPRVVSDGERVLLGPGQSGDEPYMLAQNLSGIPVLVDPNRVKSATYAVRRFGADTLILDDGFQYFPLQRKLDFVLIDAENPFGNGYLLPRGTLREPLRNLERAGFFFLTKTNGIDTTPLKRNLNALNPGAEIIETVHQPLSLEGVWGEGSRRIGFLRGKLICVVSAIARPESFERALVSLGAGIVRHFRFMDHHRFTGSEVEAIMDYARREGVDAVVTTEKDSVRFPAAASCEIPLFFLKIEIKITSGAADFTDCVARICYL